MGMMMMLMLDSDDTTTKVGCDKKFKINHAFKTDKTKITAASDIRAAVVGDAILGTAKSTWETEYTLFDQSHQRRNRQLQQLFERSSSIDDDGRHERTSRRRRYGPNDDDDAHGLNFMKM